MVCSLFMFDVRWYHTASIFRLRLSCAAKSLGILACDIYVIQTERCSFTVHLSLAYPCRFYSS